LNGSFATQIDSKSHRHQRARAIRDWRRFSDVDDFGEREFENAERVGLTDGKIGARERIIFPSRSKRIDSLFRIGSFDRDQTIADPGYSRLLVPPAALAVLLFFFTLRASSL
jgi:hypothetical protein